MAVQRKWKLFGYVTLITIVIAVAGIFLLNTYLARRLSLVMKEKVKELSKGKYQLSAENFSVNILNGSIDITGFHLIPVGNAKGAATYIVKAAEMKAKGISFLRFLNKKELNIRSLHTESTEISLFQAASDSAQAPDSVMAGISNFELISEDLHSLFIQEINIKNLKMNVFRQAKDSAVLLLSATDNALYIRDFLINEETYKNGRLFQAKKFDIEMNKFSYHLADGLYAFQGKKLRASYTDSLVTIDSFLVMPKFSKKDFGTAAGRQASRTQIIFPEIGFKEIDVKHFFEMNSLIAGRLVIRDCNIDIYRDNNIPLKPIVRPSMQAMIRDIPFPVFIRTIEMKNGKVHYEDIAEGTTKPGIMSLDKMNGIITGVSNDSASYTAKSAIKADVTCVFMKKGKCSASYNFPLSSRNERSYCSGLLSSFPMVALNPLVQPGKDLTVISGTLDSMKFSFSTDGRVSHGEMILAYRDLEVMAGDEKDRNLKDKVKTFFSTQLVLKEGNPGKRGSLRVVRIEEEKNQYRYFPYFFMQSLLTGITASIEGEKKAKFLRKTNLLGKK